MVENKRARLPAVRSARKMTLMIVTEMDISGCHGRSTHVLASLSKALRAQNDAHKRHRNGHFGLSWSGRLTCSLRPQRSARKMTLGNDTEMAISGYHGSWSEHSRARLPAVRSARKMTLRTDRNGHFDTVGVDYHVLACLVRSARKMTLVNDTEMAISGYHGRRTITCSLARGAPRAK